MPQSTVLPDKTEELANNRALHSRGCEEQVIAYCKSDLFMK